jgi:hypothetical protein
MRDLMLLHKWSKPNRNMTVGSLVLIVDSDRPRGSWLLGRVMKVYLGSDNVIRVVDVKTKFGIYKRPVVKLIPLD